MATIGGKKIATTASGHFAPGPTPAVSFVPPPPPTGPVTAPFAYIAMSATATATSTKLKVGRAPALTEGSVMQIQVPGNLPGQPTGGDIVTHVVNAKAEVFTGAPQIKAEGKFVACTTDQVRLNVPFKRHLTVQALGRLVMLDQILFAPSETAYAATAQVILDPISVVSGAVVDEDVDLAIPGLIPVLWKRIYSTARASEHTPLGRGGWTHSYHQWLELDGSRLRLRDADGATLEMDAPGPGVAIFNRSRQIEITLDKRGGGTVVSLQDGLRRTFAPIGGSKAYLREVSNTCGHKLLLEYEHDRLTCLVDTARRTLEISHDQNGHITSIAAFARSRTSRPRVEALQTVSFAYDEDGALSRVSDALGHVFSYTYDERRRLVRKTLPTGISFHYSYDPETGRCIRSWGDGGIHAGDIHYDLENGVTRLTGNLEPRIFNWRLQDGAVVGISSPDGQFARTGMLDEDGLLLESRNAAGEGFSYGYDARGHLQRIVDALGRTVALERKDDLLVRRTAGNGTTEYVHDHRGMPVSIKYPGGATIMLSYDEHGRLKTISGPSGPRATLSYDEYNNVVEEKRPRGAVLRFTYDDLGRPLSFTDQLGRTIRHEVDALGNVVAVHYPDGSSVRADRDAMGRTTRLLDSSGRTFTYRYAGLRSPVEIVRPDGATWTFEYDTNERLQRAKNPRGEMFDFRYDRAGNLRETRSFDGRITRFAYGKNHRLARVERPDGAWHRYRYDAAGRIVAEESPHGAVKVESSSDGRKERYVLDDPTGEVVVEAHYDELGRLTAEVQNGRPIRYEYDAQNRCVARQLPAGQVTRYGYDEEDNVIAVEHDGYRVELRRDMAGSLLGRAFVPAGIESRRVLDSMMRITREWVGTPSRTLIDRLYTYDAEAQLVSMNDARWGDVQYRYDAGGRLVEAASRSLRELFEYDAAGSLQPAGAGWDVAPGNVLRSTDRAEYAYDEASRRIRETRRDTGEQFEYFWDCRDRLREVVRPDGTRVLMTYDAFGRRVRKEVVGPVRPTSGGELPAPPPRRVVEYVWDGACLAAEIDSERGTRVFVHEPGTMVPLLQQEGEAIHAIVTDHLGAPTELITQRGQVVWSARRSVWGVVLDTDHVDGQEMHPLEPPFRLLGQQHDADVGLCYVRHRWFDPAVARFLSPDPLDLQGGPNLFAFNGNPTTHVDPLGLACILIGDPRLDAAIKHILDHHPGKTTPPGWYEVYVHGRPKHFDMLMGLNPSDPKAWVPVHTQDVIERIRTAGNYSGGKILLNSCETGRSGQGVAHDVSKAFHTTVAAPNERVWGFAQVVAPNDPANPQTYHPTVRGQWNYWDDGSPHLANRYLP